MQQELTCDVSEPNVRITTRNRRRWAANVAIVLKNAGIRKWFVPAANTTGHATPKIVVGV